ncbi:hypothetical protein GCM10009837_42240 [Streptomyces durmitorensis]
MSTPADTDFRVFDSEVIDLDADGGRREDRHRRNNGPQAGAQAPERQRRTRPLHDIRRRHTRERPGFPREARTGDGGRGR